jgi:DNA-directed RNA polymerase specialized sigma24 family protein
MLAAQPEYRDDGPSFRSCPFAIAHNTLADDLRARRPVAILAEALDLDDPAPTPERLGSRLRPTSATTQARESTSGTRSA